MSQAGSIKNHILASRRAFLGSTIALPAILTGAKATTAQIPEGRSFGILAAVDDGGASVSLNDPASGDQLARFDIGPRPNAAWATPVPGIALVRTETSIAIADANVETARPIPVPETVAPNLAPTGIQFRGSAGYERILIGTPNFDANTFLVDLLTGERMAVIGLLGADHPPVSLQNVAVAADDRRLLAWDGRTTWIVDIGSRASHVIGSGQFTFSAGFNSDGSAIAYSQQMADGSTQLLLQNSDGSGERLLGERLDAILVSLWIPARDLLLLDERTDEGGALSVLDPATGASEDLLEYAGATNIVQFSPDGEFALVGIEGGQGRDWYRIRLSLTTPSARMLAGLGDAVVHPGFDFHAAWALALPAADESAATTVKAIDLASGAVSPLFTGITSDAALSGQVVAPSGNAALLTVDSFTELAVHYLRLDQPNDVSVSLMKGGTGVIAPDGSGFAVAHDLNTGGTATVVYDQTGAEGATFPGEALAWI